MTHAIPPTGRRDMAPAPEGRSIPGAPIQGEPKGLTQAEIRQLVLELLG